MVKVKTSTSARSLLALAQNRKVHNERRANSPKLLVIRGPGHPGRFSIRLIHSVRAGLGVSARVDVPFFSFPFSC
jgi:hypothetical protein